MSTLERQTRPRASVSEKTLVRLWELCPEAERHAFVTEALADAAAEQLLETLTRRRLEAAGLVLPPGEG